MNWAKMIAFLAISVVAGAQTQPPPPQTARQAVLEIILGQSPKAVERHIPENTLEIFNKADAGIAPMLISQISGIQSQLKREGNHLESFDAGPLLIVSEATENNHQKRIEVAVDRDDLSGDEDQIELSMRVYYDGVLQRMPVVPGLMLDLKDEQDIWRLNQLTVTIHVPLSDVDYVKGIAEEMRRNRQRMAEYQAIASLQAAKAAEVLYQNKSSAYTCNLAALGKPWEANSIADGQQSYVFKITNCSSTSFTLVAEPAKDGPARRALCVDGTGKILFSNDGKGTTCLGSGKSVDELENDNNTDHIVGIRGAID